MRAKYKQLVNELIQLWKPILGIETWTVNVTWVRRLKERRAAQVRVTGIYKIADMEFSEAELRGANTAEIENTVVHELCHILTEPLALLGDDDETAEVVTTDVERAIVRARNAGMAICGED